MQYCSRKQISDPSFAVFFMELIPPPLYFDVSAEDRI